MTAYAEVAQQSESDCAKRPTTVGWSTIFERVVAQTRFPAGNEFLRAQCKGCKGLTSHKSAVAWPLLSKIV